MSPIHASCDFPSLESCEPQRWLLLLVVVVAIITVLIVGTDNLSSSWAGNRLMIYLLHSLPHDASWTTPQPALAHLESAAVRRAPARAKGIWWFWDGEYERAQQYLESPSFPAHRDRIVALYLGASYWALGEKGLAGETWREASASTFLDYFLQLSQKARGTGNLTQALAFLGMAESIAPTDGSIFLERARIARQKGAQVDEVIHWLELAISHYPYPADAFETLGEQYSALGNYQASVETLQKGRELYPDSFLYTLGRNLIYMGRHKEAIPFLARFVELAPWSAPGWKRLGVSMAAVGDSHGAVKSFLRAGSRYEEAGQLQAAVEMYCEALGIAPTESLAQERLQILGASCQGR